MCKDRQDVAPDWYARAFDDFYPILYAHRSVEAAEPEAAFAAACLELKDSDNLLDLCCGNGRHMKHLQRLCGFLTGLDYSPDLLLLARQKLGAGTPLIRADMRDIPFVETFDAVTNFFTSFGYFIDPNDNFRVLSGLAAALKPKGRFFIDYVNRENVIDRLIPESHRTHAGYDIHDLRWYDSTQERLNKRTTVSYNKTAIRTIEESVKLYKPGEFEQLLRSGGLRIEALYGDYSGVQLTSDSPRMIAVGTRE